MLVSQGPSLLTGIIAENRRKGYVLSGFIHPGENQVTEVDQAASKQHQAAEKQDGGTGERDQEEDMSEEQEGQGKGRGCHDQQKGAEPVQGQAGAHQDDPADSTG